MVIDLLEGENLPQSQASCRLEHISSRIVLYLAQAIIPQILTCHSVLIDKEASP